MQNQATKLRSGPVGKATSSTPCRMMFGPVPVSVDSPPRLAAKATPSATAALRAFTSSSCSFSSSSSSSGKDGGASGSKRTKEKVIKGKSAYLFYMQHIRTTKPEAIAGGGDAATAGGDRWPRLAVAG